MAKQARRGDQDNLRLLGRMVKMYYLDGKNQAEIGQVLGISTSRVNRLLLQARTEGMVEVKIRLPYQHLFDMEARLKKVFGLQEATVIPPVPPDEEGQKYTLGSAAASVLLRHVRDGDVIAIGGGTGVSAMVEALEAGRSYDVQIVPMVGGLQRRPTMDVNYLASALAEKLGGRAYQLHAPAFVETPEQVESLMSLGPVREVLNIARQASIAVMGVGSLRYTSWVSRLNHLPVEEVDRLLNECGGVGDVCLRVIDIDGRLCAPEHAGTILGLTIDELKAIPTVIAVAATGAKWDAIHGALRGGYAKILVTDEAAAAAVLEHVDAQLKAHLGVLPP